MNWASGCSSHIPCRTAHGQADRIGPPAPPQTGPARILHNRWEHSVYTVPYFISPYPHIPCCIRQQKRRRPQGIPYPAGSAFAVHTHYHTTVPGSFQACGPFYPNCTFARKKYIIGNNKTTKGADGRAPRKERLYGKRRKGHRVAHRRGERLAQIHQDDHRRGEHVRHPRLQAHLRRLDGPRHGELEKNASGAQPDAHPAVQLHTGQKRVGLRHDHRRNGYSVHKKCGRVLHRQLRFRLHAAGRAPAREPYVRHWHGREQDPHGVQIRLRHLQIPGRADGNEKGDAARGCVRKGFQAAGPAAESREEAGPARSAQKSRRQKGSEAGAGKGTGARSRRACGAASRRGAGRRVRLFGRDRSKNPRDRRARLRRGRLYAAFPGGRDALAYLRGL